MRYAVGPRRWRLSTCENSPVTRAHHMLGKKITLGFEKNLSMDTLILTFFYFSLKGIPVSNVFRIGAAFVF
jgi:hypothetical protein